MNAVELRNSKHIRKALILKLLLRARSHYSRFISGRKIYNLYTTTPLRFSTRRAHSSCLRTERTRGVLRLFGFSRFVVKRYLNVGEFPGMHRSSW